jgi:hypothetical protein
MYQDFCYPVTEGEFGNPLASSFLRPITQHLDDICKKYPSLSAWLQTARVTFLDRSVTITVPAGQTVSQAFNIAGGFDCIIFQRTASVVDSNPPAIGSAFNNAITEQDGGFVQIQISRKDGPVDTEQCPVGSVFGFGWLPNVRAPEFWSGSEIRELMLANNCVSDVDVTLTFTIVLL